MPTYNSAAVSDTAIAFQKPITLQQGRALRDNPIAIAEGATVAPRVMPLAINNWHARVELDNTTTPFAVTGLDPNTMIQIMGSFANGTADTAALQISVSSDGGTTWGSWVNLTPNPGSQNTRHSVNIVLNLKNGIYTSLLHGHDDLGTDKNAIRFRHSSTLAGSGRDAARLAVWAIGRAP